MELMMTSFGVAEEDFGESGVQSLFHRMPPVNMRSMSNFFMPDYAALVLCDRIILDEGSFTALEERPHWSYTRVADAMKMLYSEGFVQLVDFRSILKRNESLLQKILEHDLSEINQWVEPLRASFDIWSHFSRKSLELMRKGPSVFTDRISTHGVTSRREECIIAEIFHMMAHQMHNVYGNLAYIYRHVQEVLDSGARAEESRHVEALRHVLRSYLAYVNANIVLSNELGVGFHDWADFLPFYRRKFLSVGKEDIEGEPQIREAQKLFEVSFPEFAIADTRSLIKALQDKRVSDLRELVEKAVMGDVTFDQEFARSVLKEVLGVEREASRYRKMVSYITMPIGFVPWAGTGIQKIVEEAVGTPLEKKLKKKFRWFYLLSDLAEESKVGNTEKSE